MTNETLETILLLITLFYIAAVLGVPVWLSIKKNEALLAANSKLKPYKWGYYWGYFNILIAPLFVLLLWFDPEAQAYNVSQFPVFDTILMEGLRGLGFIIIGIGIIKRIQLAWIASVGVLLISFVFQLNWLGLGIAALNAYYAWKRRQELTFFKLSKK